MFITHPPITQNRFVTTSLLQLLNSFDLSCKNSKQSHKFPTIGVEFLVALAKFTQEGCCYDGAAADEVPPEEPQTQVDEIA